MTLTAYKYTTERTRVEHLRVKQSQYSDAAKERLRRIGSPARWIPGKWEWDCPLTPASVIALDLAAKDLGETVIWDGDLRAYADQHLKQSETEHAVRLGIERIIRETIPLDPYITRTTDDYGQPLPPLRHQAITWHWSQRVRGLLLAHDPGCLAGDTVIKIKRHGKVFPLTLAEVYRKMQGEGPHLWKKAGDTTVKSKRSLDGTLRHNCIEQALYRGERECVKVTLASGKFLVCTPDHEISTPDGWIAAGTLAVGQTVETNGRPSMKGALNPNHRGGRSIDADGYVLVSDKADHPHCDRHGCVREHRLVMEAKLGRFLLPTEVVHHINGDKQDNRIENLELVSSQAEHSRDHGVRHAFAHMDGGRGGKGGEIIFLPRLDRVLSVEPAGIHPVYDLVMADPDRNFVANGIIVHNCGKTRSATDAAGGWYRNGIIRPMQAIYKDGRHGVQGGVLVVAPKTMLKTWQIEVAKWQNASAIIIDGSASKKARLAATPAHFHIVNYEGLKYAAANEYDSVICDEIHRCSNSTNQTHHVLGLAQKAKRILGLSGTPISNSLESIFYPSLIIDGGKALGPSRKAFTEKFFKQISVGGGFTKNIPLDDSVRQISERIAEFTYFVKKEEVLDLPPKTHTPVFLEMTDEQERYYQQVKNEAVTYIQDASVTVEQAAARMMKLLQICQGFALADDGGGRHFTDAKTLALTDLLTNELSSRKVVVWGYFNYEIERLTRMLSERQIPHIRIDGTITSQKVRDDSMDRWNSDPSLRVYIRQLSMSEGVTLHAKDSQVPCFDCIYLGLSYRYVDWKQSQDRIHRIGQRFACSYTYYLTENGIDRAVYESVLAKDKLAGDVQTITKDYYLSLLNAKLG